MLWFRPLHRRAKSLAELARLVCAKFRRQPIEAKVAAFLRESRKFRAATPYFADAEEAAIWVESQQELLTADGRAAALRAKSQ